MSRARVLQVGYFLLLLIVARLLGGISSAVPTNKVRDDSVEMESKRIGNCYLV